MLATYLVIYFLGPLRGKEGFMVELDGLIQYIYDGIGESEEFPRVVILLLGKSKKVRIWEAGEYVYRAVKKSQKNNTGDLILV